ncbi:reverse transcriptase domain-containing protein [Tanacetum coccineum]
MGNGTDVAVPLESIRAISKRLNNTAYGFFLGKRVAYPVVANYFSSMDGLDSMLENRPWFIRNNPLILKKWDPDVNLLKKDVVNVPVWVKVHDVPVTAFSKDGLSAIATKLDTIVMAMPKLVGEGFYTCTVRVEYEWKPPSGNKKKDAESRKEVSNSNPFDVLNSIENDVDLGTNEETSNLASKEANSSGSSFWNGKPLKKADYSDDHDSEDEGALVDNKITSFLASERVGYGTNSLLEQ